MKICKNCIMPDSFPGVIFDNGVCSFCRDYNRFPQSNKAVSGKDRLLKILTSENAGKYHCVVPLSGGKDSSYILFYVVRELRLKPLAVFFDSGFATDISKRNIEKICKKLSVDLVIGKSKFRQKLVKEILYTAKYRGKFSGICHNCESNIRTTAINEATKRKIPFIIWGSTDFERYITEFSGSKAKTFRESFGATTSVKKELKKIIGQLLAMLRLNIALVNKCRTILHYLKHIYYCIRDNINMRAPEGWEKFSPFLEVSFENKDVKTIFFYDYIKYNPYKYIEILKREVGWEAPFGREIRMDCKLHSIANYQYLKDTGITPDGFSLSVLVRNGLLNRTEAIEKEEIIKRDLKRECLTVCEEVDVDVGNIV